VVVCSPSFIQFMKSGMGDSGRMIMTSHPEVVSQFSISANLPCSYLTLGQIHGSSRSNNAVCILLSVVLTCSGLYFIMSLCLFLCPCPVLGVRKLRNGPSVGNVVCKFRCVNFRSFR